MAGCSQSLNTLRPSRPGGADSAFRLVASGSIARLAAAWPARLPEGDRGHSDGGASQDGAGCPGEVVSAGERLRGVGGSGARGRERGEDREAEGPADLPSSTLSQGCAGQLALVEVEAYLGTPPELSVTRPPATA